MATYYNDNDPFVVAWLRALIKAGQIPEGDVDDRSITDVTANDLRGFTHAHFFAGIGGWPLALRLAGWPDDRPVWTGSCPCQPFSVIGKHRGDRDTRHLWPIWFRLVAECRPATVFGEQVARAAGYRWFAGIRVDLENAGYAVGAADLCAASVGAPHRRQRVYFVAHAERARLERLAGHGDDGDEPRRVATDTDRSTPATSAVSVDPARLDEMFMLRRVDLHDSRYARKRLPVSADRAMENGSVWERFELAACADLGWRRTQPGVFPLATRVPGHVGRLRGYGNAIVPQVAAAFVAAYLEGEAG